MERIISLEKSLALNITGQCNFQCRTCIREYGSSSNLEVDLLEQVLPEAVSLGYGHVGITGGEPCLHPDFDKVVDVIVNSGATFNFVSNGSLLEKYKFLAKEYVENLRIANFSLDGASRETNDLIRQEGSFDKTIEAIGYFVEKGVNTVVNVTLNRLNQHDLEGMVRLAANLGVAQVIFSAVIANSINRDIVLNDAEKRTCFSRLARLGSEYKIPVFPGNPLMIGPGVDGCVGISLLSSPMINPRGEFVFCCNTIREGAVVGSLRERSFSELYKKMLDISGHLRHIRVDRISEGIPEEGFRSCEFCNKYLSEYIE